MRVKNIITFLLLLISTNTHSIKSHVLLYILALLSLSSLAHDSNLNTYQNNQIQQVAGQAYSAFFPELNTRLRQKPSLNSKVIAILNNDDRDHPHDKDRINYRYLPYDDRWIKVLSLEGKLAGYSHRSLFNKVFIFKYEDVITTPDNTYKLEFIGLPLDLCSEVLKRLPGQCTTSYGQNKYHYKITTSDGEIVYEKGRLSDWWDDEYLKKEFVQQGEYPPTQFHTLDIQGKRVGWLLGWKHDKTWKDIDFSYARIIVPTGNKIYTTWGRGYNMKSFADLLDKKDNQLLITSGRSHTIHWGVSSIAWYYIPWQHLITLKNNNVDVVEGGNITLSNKIIERDPYYAYALAVITNDYEGIRKSSKIFEDILQKVSTACPDFNLTVEEVCPKCKKRKVFRSDSYESNFETEEIRACLSEVLSFEAYYHLFYSVGLYPSKKVIDDYLENKYRHESVFY